jgi:hypothetical protein
MGCFSYLCNWCENAINNNDYCELWLLKDWVLIESMRGTYDNYWSVYNENLIYKKNDSFEWETDWIERIELHFSNNNTSWFTWYCWGCLKKLKELRYAKKSKDDKDQWCKKQKYKFPKNWLNYHIIHDKKLFDNFLNRNIDLFIEKLKINWKLNEDSIFDFDLNKEYYIDINVWIDETTWNDEESIFIDVINQVDKNNINRSFSQVVIHIDDFDNEWLKKEIIRLINNI